MNKAVFFDRDGTINVERNYVHTKEDFDFIPGVINALKFFRMQGYLLVLITNQSGIARGYYTEKDLSLLHQYMQSELQIYNAAFDKIYFCPHHPEALVPEYRMTCTCRKPGGLLFKKAIEELSISPGKSIAIGDKTRDLIPAEQLGMRCILLSDQTDDSIKNRWECYSSVADFVNVLRKA